MSDKPQIPFDDFIKLDLRIATITACEPHPNADRLLKIQLDDGSEAGRQVCAGIRQWYEPDQLIGKQVAIPHSRSLGCNELTVIFARVPKGIKFDAVDKKPVHLVFMILAPYQDKGNRYLPLLGKIVETVKDDKRRKKLIDTDSFDEFLKILEG